MYVYAFLKTPTTALELPEGLANSLQLVEQGALSAVVESQLDPDTIRAGDERFQLQAILSHDRVLQDLFQQTDVLPVPFGTFLVSLDALTQHLAAHQEVYVAKLQQVIHKAEYTLKAHLHPLVLEELPESAKGKDYFLAKKRRYQQQETYRNQQQEQLAGLLEAIAQLGCPYHHSEPKDGVERIHILGDRDDHGYLQQQVEQWQMDCPLWELSLGAALPPYHFV
ncbi:MAG: GvpL/GvpF family gas vesicle protein [Synechococcales cyanobacterium K44_A2020_017]|nr:GvpL/GvpF family gas vesicle protein [Synechococcales cyanobacterium K32_A2020_035]MBF2095626.1 GvpL/GvpF family gas vesicle protein [Synechococcales cyanobacterium K44_A2020_017]